MDEELLIPFGQCPKCDKEVPVILKEFDFDEKEVIDIVACPICYDVLNLEGQVELQYYGLDEVERLGYKVVREEEEPED